MKQSAQALGVVVGAMLIAALAACAPRTGAIYPGNVETRTRNAVMHYENESIVIVGIKTLNSNIDEFKDDDWDYDLHAPKYGIMRQNGKYLDYDGSKAWGWKGVCDIGGEGTCVDGTAYHYYYMPPGTYALGWLRSDFGTYIFVKGSGVSEARQYLANVHANVHRRVLIYKANAHDGTPQFEVKANEVVYVGDIVIDLADRDKPTSAYAENTDAARQLLATIETAAGEMVFRPWSRPAGPGPQPVLHKRLPPMPDYWHGR